MGTLWSHKDWSHQLVINGCQLGDAVEIDGDPLTFEWDHVWLPSGEILEDGTVVVVDELPA